MEDFINAWQGKTLWEMVDDPTPMPAPATNPLEPPAAPKAAAKAAAPKAAAKAAAPPQAVFQPAPATEWQPDSAAPWRRAVPLPPAPKARSRSPFPIGAKQKAQPPASQRPPEPLRAPQHAAPPLAASSSSSSSSSSTAQVQQSALEMYKAAELAVRQASLEATGSINEDKAYKWTERQLATQMNIKRRDRGPKDDPDVWKWRNQLWRPGSNRFSTRGGKSREHFKQKYGRRDAEQK